MIAKIKAYMDTHTCEIHCVDTLLNKFKIDRTLFYEHFRLLYGQSPKEYLLSQKLHLLIKMIENDDDNNIAFYYAHALGFQTSAGLCNMIKRKTGLTFREFKNKIKKRTSGIRKM